MTPRTRLTFPDLLDEALAGVSARPARLIITALGTVLGIGALVATLGLAQTASGQVASHFDRLAATHISVEPGDVDNPTSAEEPLELPWDAETRLTRLNGAEAAGTYTRLALDESVRSLPIIDPTETTDQEFGVVAASPGLIEALSGTIVSGRVFDFGHDQRGDQVAVLGANAAVSLHISRVDTQPTIFIGDRPFTAIGIATGVTAKIDLLDSVIIPNGTARRLYGLPAPAEVHVRTALGAAQLIGEQAPVALAPNQPGSIQANVPSAPTTTRQAVTADVNALFVVLGGVALLVGGLGIANVTLLSVLERVAEIGLRRTLGAARRHIAAQFLVESITTGLLGGLVGTSAGIVLTVIVSGVNQWTPILDPRLAVIAPVLGAVIGLAAGAYPAWKASTIEPINALHSA